MFIKAKIRPCLKSNNSNAQLFICSVAHVTMGNQSYYLTHREDAIQTLLFDTIKCVQHISIVSQIKVNAWIKNINQKMTTPAISSDQEILCREYSWLYVCEDFSAT